MIGCVGKGAATSATTRQTRMSVLPWKGREGVAGDEGVEGAEEGGEFGGGFSFLRVAFHAAGNQVAVGIAPRARLRHDVVQALDRRRGAAQTVEALLALARVDCVEQRLVLHEVHYFKINLHDSKPALFISSSTLLD